MNYQKTGTQTASESYVLDPNSNIVQKTQNGKVTSFQYDKNRLISQTKDGVTSTYQYDPMGRIDKVVAGSKVLEQYKYDPFDNIQEHIKLDKDQTTQIKTQFTYDTLDRLTTKVEQAGTANAKTTTFNYLGTSDQVLSEDIAGQITKSYVYSPWGERMAMIKADTAGSETSYYQYNTDVDVEMLTDENGNIRATYGYTPYGENDDAMFTGVDKPDPSQPDKEMYNPFRYGGKRWDKYTESYDLGFRNYFPGVGRFISPDSYTDSTAHKGLFMNGMTNGLYSFTDGNPMSYTDLDGHIPVMEGTYNGEPNTDNMLTYIAATGGCLYDPSGSCKRKADSKTMKRANAHYGYVAEGKKKPVYNKQAKKEQTQRATGLSTIFGGTFSLFGAIDPSGRLDAARVGWMPPGVEFGLDIVLFAITIADEVPGDEAVVGVKLARSAGQVFEGMDPAKFARMKRAFERQGGLIVREDEAEALLNYHGVEASTLDAKTIAFRRNPSVSAVFEEFIHATQYRTGRADGTPLNSILMEIEAKEKLIKFRKAYGIPNWETRETIQHLRDYRRQLEEWYKRW